MLQQGALHFNPWQQCSFRLGFCAKHSTSLQLVHKVYPLIHFQAVCSRILVYRADWTGCNGGKQHARVSKWQQGGFEPARKPVSLVCGSGLLPLRYRTPLSDSTFELGNAPTTLQRMVIVLPQQYLSTLCNAFISIDGTIQRHTLLIGYTRPHSHVKAIKTLTH